MTRKFGIELEFNDRYYSKKGIEFRDLFERCNKIIPSYDNKHSFLRWNESARTWNLKEDSSCGYELTSPVLSLNKPTLEKLNGILSDLKKSFGRIIPINHCCGFHAHFEISDLSLNQFKKLVSLFQKFEGSLLDLHRDNRKRSQYIVKLNTFCVDDISSIGRPRDYYRASRIHDHYTGLNTYRYRDNRKTCEIRYAEGTCDPEDVICWVLICAILIDCAKKNIVPNETSLSDLRNFVTKNGTKTIFKQNKDRMAKWIEFRAKKYKRNLKPV
jgi:hypothetical protein